jgi:hypothetical protein
VVIVLCSRCRQKLQEKLKVPKQTEQKYSKVAETCLQGRNQSKVVCVVELKPATHRDHRRPCGVGQHHAGEIDSGPDGKRALGLTKIHGKTTPGHQWNPNSPDINPAEHAVGGVRNKTKIAAGSYETGELKNIIKKRWQENDQASLDASIGSIPKRLAKVIERQGKALLKGGWLLGNAPE